MKALSTGLALVLMAFAASAAGDDFDSLMQLLAKRRHAEASFIEQHFLSLAKRPIESSGELIYDAPDRLEKRTLEPKPENLLLQGDALSVQRGHGSRVLDMKSYPQIIPFVESIRATLAGDRLGLERYFEIQFTGSLARWTILLRPRDGATARMVSQVQIDGARDVLFRVEVAQTDGDRSLMTLRAHAVP